MLQIQQQSYVTPILHNVTMHTCPTCIIHGSDLIQVKDTNLAFWIVTLMVSLTSWSMCFAISQQTPLDQCFFGIKVSKTKQRQKNPHNLSWVYLYSTS